MGKFDERKMCKPDVCIWCKHCWHITIETDEGDFREHYCMLDVPDEDVHYLDQEVLDEYHGYIPWLADLSERFCQIMKIKDFHDLWDTPRYVECTDCCNYFERPKRGEY